MKNALKLFGIIALVVVIGFSMAACGGDDDGGGGGPQTATYTGKSGNDTYTLKITENTARYAAQIGDAYELTFGSKKSTGKVDSIGTGGVLNLQPSNAITAIFIAIISGNNLAALNGTITWTDNLTSPAPGELTGGNQGGGTNANIVGTWKSSDGVDTYIFTANKYTLDKSGGGGSIINEEGTYTVSGNTVKMHDSDGPYTRTGTVNGNSMRITHDQYTWSDVTVYKQ